MFTIRMGNKKVKFNLILILFSFTFKKYLVLYTCRKNLRLVEDISCSYTPRTPLSYIFDHKVSSSPDDALPEENRLPSPVLFLHMSEISRKNF